MVFPWFSHDNPHGIRHDNPLIESKPGLRALPVARPPGGRDLARAAAEAPAGDGQRLGDSPRKIWDIYNGYRHRLEMGYDVSIMTHYDYMGLSENVGYIPNEIAMFV